MSTQGQQNMSRGEFFHEYLQVVYGPDCIEALTSWYEQLVAKVTGPVLDAACGTGIPALQLRKKGYEISCSDGSADMLATFRHNAEQLGVSGQASCVLWEDLPSEFGYATQQLVLCRGNSLVYAGNWDDKIQDDECYRVIEDSLRGMFDVIAVGGDLIVDVAATQTLDRATYPVYTTPDGRTIQLSEEVNESGPFGRLWVVDMLIDGESVGFPRTTSVYLSADLLREMLYKVGFDSVEEIKVPPERESFSVFRATRAV